jgi:protein-disulfide isomerase
MEKDSKQKSVWRTPIILIGTVIVVAVLLSVITKNNGTVSFENTENALNNILTQAERQFTNITNVNELVSEVEPGTEWLEGAEDDPTLGDDNASLVIVEFSDFQCPFCKASFPGIREFIENNDGKIKYIYRDFPVDEIHTEARMAAEAGACAHSQGKFWQLHDRMFQNQNDLSKVSILNYAKQSGINMKTFETCLEERRYQDEVEKDRAVGIELGVRGTPTWFINGEKLEGSIPIEVWDQIFKTLEERGAI